MIRFLVLLFCCLVGAQSKCFINGGAGKLPEGCTIGNLTVAPYSSPEIINSMKCNTTVDSTYFNSSPQFVGFQRLWGYAAPSYLLTAVDRTSKSVMWIVTNLTMTSNSKIYPPANSFTHLAIIPWKKPSFTPYSRHRVIEFLVFEEYRNFTYSMYHNYSDLFRYPFNLSDWIDTQRLESTGVRLCGPVAGGSVVAFQQSPAPAPGPGPTPRPGGSTPYNPPPPANHHHHKSDSNRNLFNGVLLVGVIFVHRVLAF